VHEHSEGATKGVNVDSCVTALDSTSYNNSHLVSAVAPSKMAEFS